MKSSGLYGNADGEQSAGISAESPIANPRWLILAILTYCLLVYWVAILKADLSATSGHVIGSDGLFYYEYLPSVFIDGDLDFSNQRAAMLHDGVPYTWDAGYLQRSPQTGRPGTAFSCGWALVVSPFFLLAHAYTWLFSSVTSPPPNGYGFIYESVTNFGAVFYGCLGVLLLFQTLSMWVTRWVAAAAVCVALATSNLLYYIVVQASMSHAVAFFAVSGSFYFACLLTRTGASLGHALLFGVFCGLAFIIRPQLLLCSAALFVYVAAHRPKIAHLACAGGAAAAVAAIQLAVWAHLYGSPFVIPQGDGFMRWTQPNLLEILFSRRHGLFLWHPVYLLGVLGLLVSVRRHPAVCLLGLACLAMQLYVNAVASDWWSGNAFGGRRFVDCLPFFTLGIALGMAQLISQRGQRLLMAGAFAALAAWNAAFVYQYRFGYIPRGEEITWSQLVTDKFRLHHLTRKY